MYHFKFTRMKKLIPLFVLFYPFFNTFSQSDTVQYLFMGHTRDDNRSYEHVLHTIEKMDYTNYSLTLLGVISPGILQPNEVPLNIVIKYSIWEVIAHIFLKVTTIWIIPACYWNSQKSQDIMLLPEIILFLWF